MNGVGVGGMVVSMGACVRTGTVKGGLEVQLRWDHTERTQLSTLSQVSNEYSPSLSTPF